MSAVVLIVTVALLLVACRSQRSAPWIIEAPLNSPPPQHAPLPAPPSPEKK